MTHFPAIRRDLLEIFEHVQNIMIGCDSLSHFRIVTNETSHMTRYRYDIGVGGYPNAL